MVQSGTAQAAVRPAQTQPAPPPCPLCGGPEVVVADSCTTGQLRTAWRTLGFELSDAALNVFEGRVGAELFRCGRCGFGYFDPALAGGGVFYSELQQQSGNYYAPAREEFFWTLDAAARLGLRSVLDVGCGAGAFLDLARGRGLATHGLELNPTAAEACRRKGHKVFSEDLAALAGREAGKFQLVTLFQVLEHVSDPVAFATKAAALLAPGGGLALGVPSEEGIGRFCPYDPHQWPPHHVTRWRKADLHRLAQRCGLAVLQTGSDRVVGGDAKHFWTLHNRLAAALGKAPHLGGELLPKALSFVYRKLGCKFYFPRRGPSVYGLFRKQAD